MGDKLRMDYDLETSLKQQNVTLADLDRLRRMHGAVVPEDITDHLQLLFFVACNKDFDVAAKTIRMYYEHRRNTPEHFSQRDPDSPKIQQCLQNQDYFYLPQTPKGCSVIFHRLSSPKPSAYHFDEAIKTYFMTIDSCLNAQGPANIIFLFDMKNVCLGHLTRIRISSIKKFFHYVQECLPAQLEEIHIINVVSFFDKVLSLIKPFMKAEILKKLYTHPPNANYEEIFKDIIPTSCLPAECEGDLPTIPEMHETHCKRFLRLRDFFLAEEEHRNGGESDVVKKNGAVIPASIESFSQLEID